MEEVCRVVDAVHPGEATLGAMEVGSEEKMAARRVTYTLVRSGHDPEEDPSEADSEAMREVMNDVNEVDDYEDYEDYDGDYGVYEDDE